MLLSQKLREYFENDTKVETFESINSFVKSDIVQNPLQKIEKLEYFDANFDNLKQAILHFEEEEHQLKGVIEQELGSKIDDGIVIQDSSIPEDNNEATIDGFYDPDAENIKIHLDEIYYYGDGILGTSFEATMIVTIYYCIYKSDYYALESPFEHVPDSVSDWNDHYYEANDECEVRVTGSISFDLDIHTEDSSVETLSKNISFKDIQISDIENVEFVKW